MVLILSTTQSDSLIYLIRSADVHKGLGTCVNALLSFWTTRLEKIATISDMALPFHVIYMYSNDTHICNNISLILLASISS